jgi:hypothetical protein
VVNLGATPVQAAIHLPNAPASAEIEELAGNLRDGNTAVASDAIKPRKSQWEPRWRDQRSYYTFPAHSFTVIRWP